MNDDRLPGRAGSGPDRLDVGLVVALVTGAAGVFLAEPTVFLSAIVGLTYAGYRYATRPPPLDAAVSVDRRLSTSSPLPGSEVDVTLTVTNGGEEPIPDLRVVDGVPERLPVVAGSPRLGTSLRAGESATVEYTVRARRGEHAFGDVSLVARNASGGEERRRSAPAAGTLTSRTAVDSIPLRGRTTSGAGRVPTETAGEGIEFYATREYRHGDPMRRVDWKRYAGTGELTTVEFRQERAATVVTLLDARKDARVVRAAGEPDAVRLSVYAAVRAAEALLDGPNRVAAALYGIDGAFLPPDTGRSQALRVRRFYEDAGDGDGPGVAARDWPAYGSSLGVGSFEDLLRRLPSAAQVYFFSPLLDEPPATAARRLQAHGHPVTVVVPDVAGDSPGGRLVRHERHRRLRELREDGVRAVEWSPDEPLAVDLDAATRRWSA